MDICGPESGYQPKGDIMNKATEASFTKLAGVPVHYDREPVATYGGEGVQRTFQCTKQLQTTLEGCMGTLFEVWGRPKPTTILTAGTLGDGDNEHGRGLAFDLDGFRWGQPSAPKDRGTYFMMADYPKDRRFYLGISAHLFLSFSQVLSWHYPNHRDHFHVDFNFGYRFRPESNAQTFFLQAVARHVFGLEIGKSGVEKDGVDGIYGGSTRTAEAEMRRQLGVTGSLVNEEPWRAFLTLCRDKAFKPTEKK